MPSWRHYLCVCVWKYLGRCICGYAHSLENRASSSSIILLLRRSNNGQHIPLFNYTTSESVGVLFIVLLNGRWLFHKWWGQSEKLFSHNLRAIIGFHTFLSVVCLLGNRTTMMRAWTEQENKKNTEKRVFLCAGLRCFHHHRPTIWFVVATRSLLD